MQDTRTALKRCLTGGAFLLVTLLLAFGLRMLEWPCWQNPEYRFDGEMLLATHDAYHWLAGACGFGLAVNHPMSEMLRILSGILHQNPAQVAFWFPAVLASLVAGIVFFWGWVLGSYQAGIAAGLIASISPGFLARTLLGYYDTDLVTLFFPLLISLVPACWVIRFIFPLNRPWHFMMGCKVSETNEAADSHDPIAPMWLVGLSVSGLLANWTQEWHSVFPYLVRYNALLLLFLAVMRPCKRKECIAGALAYALPCGAAWPGCIPACVLLAGLCLEKRRNRLVPDILLNGWILAALGIAALYCMAQGQILDTFMAQINAYLKHQSDAHGAGAISLAYPSVAQSIIEVQDLSFAALFPYFHPWFEASVLGFAGFLVVLFRRPSAIFLLPLAALGLSSTRLGGRMVMFGAPVMALGISLCIFWLVCWLSGKRLSRWGCGWISCVLLCMALVAPFMDLIPALSQGPSINRRHAAALAHLRTTTPENAMLWVWWDWGYAAQYFARRQTIADGARHGGPSLYLPAAVFATENARFARQIIRRTSLHDNEPGNFFSDMDADQAQDLIEALSSPGTPLVPGNGHQYLVVSFEMLKLGFWISNFGNWNFRTRQGEGGAISIVPQAVAYKLNAGEVKLEGAPIEIFPISINIFAETGLTVRNYAREWFAEHPGASAAEQKAWLASRRNVNFLFNRVTDEKLAVDQGIYGALMTRLLVCDANDPAISPYFRLIYDNVFARIYEVLPAIREEEVN